MKFTQAKTRADVTERFGRDWYKIVKTEGGYILFETRAEYNAWLAQE